MITLDETGRREASDAHEPATIRETRRRKLRLARRRLGLSQKTLAQLAEVNPHDLEDISMARWTQLSHAEDKARRIAQILEIPKDVVFPIANQRLPKVFPLPGPKIAAIAVAPRDPDPWDPWDPKREAARVLSLLPPRLRKILSMRFGLGGQPPLTLEEVGIRLGLTRERIRTLEDRALRLARAAAKDAQASELDSGFVLWKAPPFRRLSRWQRFDSLSNAINAALRLPPNNACLVMRHGSVVANPDQLRSLRRA